MYQKISIFSIVLLFIASISIIFDCGKTYAAGILTPKGASQEKSISLQKHTVRVTINNGFAQTEVDQEFFNNSDTDLEAIYSFPLPKQASLSELSLFIDGKEQIGEALPKPEAKKVYNEQKQKGNNTAHAEQDEQKTFRISVSPVRAKQPVRVRLVYYQPLEIDLGIGRYIYPLAEGGVDEEQASFWSIDDQVKGSFTFDLLLKSAVPVKEIRLPGYMQQTTISSDTHSDNSDVNKKDDEMIEPESKKEQVNSHSGSHLYTAHFSLNNTARLNKDIVLYYRLDEQAPARVELVPYKVKGKDGVFMLSITPGADLATITTGIDWTFVLDSSGSMSGEKIDVLRKGVAMSIKKMRNNDRFRIISFDDNAHDLSGGFLPGNTENMKKGLDILNTIRASGSTNLHEGLSASMKKSDEERTSVIILISDGVANVGKTEHNDFINLVRKQDVRLFTFLIGNSANRKLLEDLAKVSGGFSMDISTQDDLGGRLLQAKTKALRQNLHDVHVQFGSGEITDLVPSNTGSIYEGQQIVMFGKYKQTGLAKLTVSAKISGEEKKWQCQINLPEEDTVNPELERLWALAQIHELEKKEREMGEKDEYKDTITNIAVQHSLVTEYTSMVVVEEEEKKQYGISSENKKRVEREREAATKRENKPVQNYRADSDGKNSMFKGKKSLHVGSGAIDPLLLLILFPGAFIFLKRKSLNGKK